MTNILSIVVGILMLSASITSAAEYNLINKSRNQLQHKSSVSDPCDSTGGMGQVLCAEKHLEIADKKLNATYKMLITKLQGGDWPHGADLKKDITAAQRLWIKYRDANCQFVGGLNGGSSEWQGASYENCRVRMTEERTKELQSIIEESM